MSVIDTIPILNQKLLGPLKIDPDRTTESIEARKLENKLLIEFNAILIQIKNKIDFSLTDYKMQFGKVKESLKQTVYDIIRSYYQQTYTIGSNYVNKALGTSAYLTESDIEHIKTQSENFSNRFWGRLEKMLETSTEKAIKAIFDTGSFNGHLVLDNQREYFAKRIEETKSYLYSSLAVLIITDALNSATIRKAKTIYDNLVRQTGGGSSNLLTGAVTLEQTDFQLMDIEMIRLLMILNTLKYRWYTSGRDSVCKFCRSLEGKTWTLSLSLQMNDIMIPGQHSHFNCACRLLLEADI